MHELVTGFADRREEMVQLLKQLVELESPSSEKPAVDALGAFLAGRLRQLGCQVDIIEEKEYGNHILASWGTGDPPILVLCHMDTVWPTGEIKKRPFRVEGNKAFGPGAFDMKCGIVQTIFALEAAQKRGLTNRRVVMLFNSDEEPGSLTSRPLIEEQARQAKVALVLEPSVPPGALKTFRKGVGRFELRIKGRAAHSGADFEKGISAIEELARQVLKLHRMTDIEKGTTVNVGVVSGGTRPNVVAAEARAEVDLRAATLEEAEKVVAEILSLKPELKGTELEMLGGLNRPPMERTAAIVELFNHARSLAQELGFGLTEAGTGGGSDGNFTAALGVPTLDGLGAVGDGGHAVHEYVDLDYLPQRTALLTRLFETL